MERYTKEFQGLIDDAKVVLAFAIPEILENKAEIKLKNKKDRVEIKGNGNRITQLFMLATATANLVDSLNEDNAEMFPGLDAFAVFTAAVELIREFREGEKE